MKPLQKITSELVLLADLEHEPIQFIEHIQPHGALLGVTGEDLEIVQASQNTCDYLGIAVDDLLGHPLDHLFQPGTVGAIATAIERSRRTGELSLPIRLTLNEEGVYNRLRKSSPHQDLFAILYQRGDMTILEIEPLPLSRPITLDDACQKAQEVLLAIRQATSPAELYQAVVTEFRRLTGFDRVMLYRFDHDRSGIVEAEDLAEGLEPYRGLHYPPIDIPPMARTLFMHRAIRLIPDVQYQPVPIASISNDMPPVDLLQSSLRGISECHRQYLKNMGSAATLTVPIVNEANLWGLIACHHYSPRQVDYDTQRILELLGKTTSLQLFLQEEQEVKKTQMRIREIEGNFHRDLKAGAQTLEGAPIEFSRQIERLFQNNHTHLLELGAADGVAIALDKHIIRAGQTPDESDLHDLLQFLRSQIDQDIFYTDSLAECYSPVEHWETSLPGLLSLSIVVNQTSYHILWFRTEQVYTVDWGGNPHDAIATDNKGAVCLSPRRSFQVWKEEVSGRSLPWTTTEIHAAQSLRHALLVTALESSQSSLVKAAADANKANEAKSEFLANMSHEIRTPMNAILGFAQLLEETPLDSDQTVYLSAILKGGESLLAIINDILDLSKMEAGELKLNYTEFHLVHLLTDLVTLLRPQATQKGLTLTFDIAPDIPHQYFGAEQRLQQVLTNLVRNAIKFTHQGYVKVTVAPDSSYSNDSSCSNESCSGDQCIALMFSVEDTGIGLDEASQQQIFDAFTQVESSLTRQYEGTGLGLTICRKIVALMGGDIGVTSTLGEGSTFWFTACLQPRQTMTESSLEDEKLAIAPHLSICILVVENTAMNQLLMIKTLQKIGYTADAVANGQEALDRLAQKAYDVVLMDCQMPVLDGYEATRQLRQREQVQQHRHTPVIGLTAFAMESDRQKCLDAGMDDYISKPVRIHQLKTLLERYVRSPSL